MYRYIPPSERRARDFGRKVSFGGIFVCLVLSFSIISAVSAVQASLEKPEAQVSELQIENSSLIESGQVVAKQASTRQISRQKLTNVNQAVTNLPVERVWPVRGRITTYYSGYHPAIDIAITWGTKVRPFASGVVVFAGWQGNLGYNVIINHNDGWVTMYSHLARIDVALGQQVDTSTQIGIIGSTGRSTGPHLHFEVSQYGRKINPLSVLP